MLYAMRTFPGRELDEKNKSAEEGAVNVAFLSKNNDKGLVNMSSESQGA